MKPKIYNTNKNVNNGVKIYWSIFEAGNQMRAQQREPGEWVDGFLFVANLPILDFLNTKPVLAEGPTELLVDVHAMERWFIGAGIVSSAKAKSLMRNWRNSSEAASLLKNLIAFRECLREAVLRIEDGLAPGDEFLQEINSGLVHHPPVRVLSRRKGQIVRQPLLNLSRPSDLWAPLLDGAADLLSEREVHRIRKCEACVIHFFDTSKKGSRRWCSMNICGNKLKVAAYQQRKRGSK